MRILAAPDCFTGTLTAPQAAAAMADGWARERPDDEVDLCPVSDGGPGFAEALHCAAGGTLLGLAVSGPRGDRVPASVLVAGSTAYVESAYACGLHLIPADRRDPRTTTTYGVGECLRAAAEAGARRIVVGLGGSGTTDGGAGMLAALGATAADTDGRDATDALRSGGRALARLGSVDLTDARRAMAGVELVAASDVDVPLLGARGAARGFARQKGADDAAVEELEAALAGLAAAIGRAPDGRDPSVALGAGAAGGLGYGLLCLGATRVPGIATVLDAVDIDTRCARADLVLTGEGSFDWQSLRGKAVSGVAERAVRAARPVAVLAGRVEVGRREWSAAGVAAAYSVTEHAGSAQASMADPAGTLATLAAAVARSWSR